MERGNRAKVGRGEVNHQTHTCWGLIALALILVACGNSGESAPTVTPTPPPSVTPLPTQEFPPTWTPSPLPPTRTPAPSATSTLTPTLRPTRTPTPGLTPGAVIEENGRVIVTALAEHLNAGIASIYFDQSPGGLNAPPVITLGYAGQFAVDLAFYNAFLDEEGTVSLEALLSIGDGQIILEEQPDTRRTEGALVADRDVRAALGLVQAGLNLAVSDLAGLQPDTFLVESVYIRPDYLEATLITEIG